MDIRFKLRSHSKLGGLRSFIEGELEELQGDVVIESACVELEDQPEMQPPCRARALLVVPGPDIQASARDHTLLAAWLKVSRDLKRQIKQRKVRQIVRLKGNQKLRGLANQRDGTLVRR